MSEVRGLRLAPSAAAREKRLAALLEGRPPGPALQEAVEDAQLLGSLELAGLPVSWGEVVGSRHRPGPEPVMALRRARAAVDPGAPVGVASLRAWQTALLGPGAGFRTAPHPREGTAPPELIPGRLAVLEEWLNGDSGRDLKPVQQAALALARIVEILPFPDGNGRVSRLAAAHLVARGGLRPPILAGGDRPRLEGCLRAAFRLDTEPLCALLVEASDRGLDVMIQTLERSPG